MDGSCITIDPAMPSKPGKILDELSSGGHLDGFSKSREEFQRPSLHQATAISVRPFDLSLGYLDAVCMERPGAASAILEVEDQGKGKCP